MKHLIILADGAADYPLEQLGGKTPLQAASTPHIDRLCSKSRLGMLETVPPEMPPGSEVANLAVLGYDVRRVYQGRGVLEAASMGIDLAEDDLAMRCNLICLSPDGTIKNHSAGHISSEESRELIAALNEELQDPSFAFYPGVSYRHLFVLSKGNNDIVCTPPHDVPGTDYREVLVTGSSPEGHKSAVVLNGLIEKSRKVLAEHQVNRKRVSAGKDPANAVWFWSAGYRPQMQTFRELYGKSGAVISAVDLIYGIGAYAGLEPVYVEGATGLYTTNYEGKAHAAIEALRRKDFVFLHIEASDEAGHEGDAELKVKTIEYLDKRVIASVVAATKEFEEPVSIALLPDHPTPCALRTHVHDPVPVLIYVPGKEGDHIARYNEDSATSGSLGLMHGSEFIQSFFA